MYKKLFLITMLSTLFIACEKKTSDQNISEKTIEKSVVKQEKKQKILEDDGDEKIKLKQVPSLTNPKKFKLNFILVTQVGCGACEKVKEYMQEEDLKAFIDKDFVVQEVDINFKEELPFPWMKPFATPTLYFLDDKNEEVIDTVVARLTKKQLIDKMKEALDMRDMD